MLGSLRGVASFRTVSGQEDSLPKMRVVVLVLLGTTLMEIATRYAECRGQVGRATDLRPRQAATGSAVERSWPISEIHKALAVPPVPNRRC